VSGSQAKLMLSGFHEIFLVKKSIRRSFDPPVRQCRTGWTETSAPENGSKLSLESTPVSNTNN
jgi:hypothetical protein